MDSFPYWRIDAFVDGPRTGNPAAIIECVRWLDDGQMLALAEESGGTATAFLVPDESVAADWQVRWFAPQGEIQLCGHATIACAHMLLGASDAGSVAFRSRHAGVIDATRSTDGVEIGLPCIPTERADWSEAATIIGCEPVGTYRSDAGYAVFVLETEEEVRSLAPDFEALAALGDSQITCTAEGRQSQIVSRVFTPRAGTGEDIATGSAHAVLAPIWAERLARECFTAIQASTRGGRLEVRTDGDVVWLGGRCTTLVEGTFYLSG